MIQSMQLQGYLPILPEIVLAVGAMLMLMVGVGVHQSERSAMIVNGFCIAVLALAAAVVVWLPAGRTELFGGSFVVDDYARFLKLLALAGSGGALMLSLDWLTSEHQQKFEYGVLFLLSTLGMMLLISANDLIALYLGLEMMSLPLYVVAASNRDNVRSTEAGLKYFVLGALSSGMLLYGASLIYGFTGTVNFAGIAKASGQGANIGLIFGLVFLFVGFCFKISAVPFHMWTPDVYEGAPTPVTAFFAAAPKVAGDRDVRARDHGRVSRPSRTQWQQIVVFVSIASMVLGAFAAIGQTQHQAADGLFLDRPHGLRAGRPRRRNGGGRAGRAGLHGDLRGDDARHLRLRSSSMRRDGKSWRTSPIWPGSRAPIRRWRSFWRCCCSRSRVFRRSPGSSPSSTCSSPPSRPGFICSR